MIGHLKNGKIFAMHDDGTMSEVDTNTQERSLEHTLEDDLNGISFIDRIRRHQFVPTPIPAIEMEIGGNIETNKIEENELTKEIRSLADIFAKGNPFIQSMAMRREEEKMNNKFNIKQIIYNETEGITTVIFEDGEVVLVKKAEGTEHNIYQAVASAVVRRVYGSNTAYKRQIENVKVITPKPKKSPEEQFESALNNFVGYILGKINNEDTEEGED